MKHDRRMQIIDMVTSNRAVKNAELMKRFDISIETVRRDLEYLETQGYLRRVYGGAVANVSLGSEPEYSSRSQVHETEKDAIAAAAARLICPEETIYLGVGTTIQAMAQHISKTANITALTNVVRTAVELSEIPSCNVILSGGTLRAKELTLSGFPAEQNFSYFNVDKAFIGIGGITADGITDFHIGEAQLHRQLIKNARKAIVLCDSSKIGIKAMNNVCHLADIDIVITDSKAPKQLVKEIEEKGVKVIIAK